jgi:hypothetical protein
MHVEGLVVYRTMRIRRAESNPGACSTRVRSAIRAADSMGNSNAPVERAGKATPL